MVKVGLHKGNSILSKAISFFTKSQFTHAYLIIDEYQDKYLIFEADLFGVRLDLKDKKYINQSRIFQYEFDLYGRNSPDDCLKKVMFRFLGKGYGYLQLFGFMIYYLLKWLLGIVIRKNLFKGGYVCSEFVAIYMNCLYGVEAFKEKDLDLITPKDILNVLEHDTLHWKEIKGGKK